MVRSDSNGIFELFGINDARALLDSRTDLAGQRGLSSLVRGGIIPYLQSTIIDLEPALWIMDASFALVASDLLDRADLITVRESYLSDSLAVQ